MVEWDGGLAMLIRMVKCSFRVDEDDFCNGAFHFYHFNYLSLFSSVEHMNILQKM